MRKTALIFYLFAGIMLTRLWAVDVAEVTQTLTGKFAPVPAPDPGPLLLKKGDRLAIVGDSITEQKKYSRLIEAYLTACTPELDIRTRQFGWSGETAEGFLRRMKQDCLRFNPTVVTLSYGMNDYRYRPYDEAIARWYREKYTAVVQGFKQAGARVVVGSPGCVGRVASWVKTASGTLEEHNQHLCALRNIGIEIAKSEQTRFADVFWPMYTAGATARKRYGPDYAVSGKDGVHPGWAGQLIMAYAYLRAMGLDGQIGTFEIDLATGRATAGNGHRVLSSESPEFHVESHRYPFCATGAVDRDDSIRSGMSLAPFDRELNRLLLVVKHAPAKQYRVTWGPSVKIYTAEALARGVNLAKDFERNPFSNPFARVSEAVYKKQEYETRQIKKLFHGREGRADIEKTAIMTEKARAPLVQNIRNAMVPVKHTLRIDPM